MERKYQSLRELAAIAEQHLTAYNRKLSSRDFNAKKTACASRPKRKNLNASSAMIRGLKSFSFEKSGHRASECASCKSKVEMLEKVSFTGAEKISHTFMQCKKQYHLSRGGATA